MSTKLVRDKIPEIVRADGAAYPWRVMNSTEMVQALRDKLVEETGEMLSATTAHGRLNEAADIVEVLMTSLRLDGYDEFDLVAARKVKRTTRGAFVDRIAMTFPDAP